MKEIEFGNLLEEILLGPKVSKLIIFYVYIVHSFYSAHTQVPTYPGIVWQLVIF